jgi:hypothetical protein
MVDESETSRNQKGDNATDQKMVKVHGTFCTIHPETVKSKSPSYMKEFDAEAV